MKLASRISTTKSDNKCVVCKTEIHPLYFCAKFKARSQKNKHQMLTSNPVVWNGRLVEWTTVAET